MNLLRMAFAVLVVQCLWPLPCVAAPTINQALAVLHAESSCNLADPSTVFSAPLLRDLTRLQISAQHEPSQRLMQAASDYLSNEYIYVQHVRAAGKYDLPGVYRARCLVSAARRQAMSRLELGEIFVVENFAWVALLSEGEYFGAGLSFIKQGEQWRFNGTASDYLGSSPRVDAVVRLLHTEWELEQTSTQCPMPEAPELSEPLLAQKLDELDTQEAEESEDYFDERNALAVAMRNAVRYYAEGKRTPPLPIAQMMMAEVLLRSLEFGNSPEPDSPLWAARVQRAANFLDLAQARGVHLDRVAPLLGWLGQIYQHGVGELKPDLPRAKRYLAWGAQWGDAESAEYLQDFASPQANSDFEPEYLPRPNRQFIEALPKEVVQCQ